MLTILIPLVMMRLAWGEKPLKFIHIAKTGGTSIEDWGKENGHSWGRFDPDMAHGGKNHYPFIFRDASLQSMNDWFVVVRNPFARVVSEFYHRQNNLFLENRSPHTPINTTQAEMNAWIQLELETRLRSSVWWHSYDQYLYVANKKQCQCNITIIYYENLLSDFRTLIHNNSLILPRSNYHYGKKLSTRNLTQETARMVYISYYQDFRLFGYARDVADATKMPKKRLTQDQVPTWDVASEKYHTDVPLRPVGRN
jgi:hypothetical protein